MSVNSRIGRLERELEIVAPSDNGHNGDGANDEEANAQAWDEWWQAQFERATEQGRLWQNEGGVWHGQWTPINTPSAASDAFMWLHVRNLALLCQVMAAFWNEDLPEAERLLDIEIDDAWLDKVDFGRERYNADVASWQAQNYEILGNARGLNGLRGT